MKNLLNPVMLLLAARNTSDHYLVRGVRIRVNQVSCIVEEAAMSRMMALPELMSSYFRAGGRDNTEDYDLDSDDEDDDDDDYDTDIHHNDWRKMTEGKFVSTMKVCPQYVHSSTHNFSYKLQRW